MGVSGMLALFSRDSKSHKRVRLQLHLVNLAAPWARKRTLKTNRSESKVRKLWGIASWRTAVIVTFLLAT